MVLIEPNHEGLSHIPSLRLMRENAGSGTRKLVDELLSEARMGS